MSDNFHWMQEINQKAEELETYLMRYKEWIGAEISYNEHLERSDLVHEFERDGYDTDSARDKASDILYHRTYDDDYKEPFSEELATIKEALEMLQKLKIKKD